MRINLRLLLMILAVLVLAAVTGRTDPVLIDDPGIADTLRVDSVGSFLSSGRAVVPVTFYNDEDLGGIEVTLTWDSPDIVIDSFSFIGSRCQGINVKGATITDTNIIIYVFPFTEPLISPGDGLLGTMYVSYLPTIPEQLVTIDSITIVESEVTHSVTFSDASATPFKPQYQTGYIDISGQSCCIGISGNVDGDIEDKVNIVDLTYLSAYLFMGGDEPPCRAEANVNGDAEGSINIVDLTYLSGYLFMGGDPPPACR